MRTVCLGAECRNTFTRLWPLISHLKADPTGRTELSYGLWLAYSESLWIVEVFLLLEGDGHNESLYYLRGEGYSMVFILEM